MVNVRDSATQILHRTVIEFYPNLSYMYNRFDISLDKIL